MSEVGRGASDLGRAFAFVRARPRLWKWLVAPAVITLLLLVALVVAVTSLADPVVAWAVRHVPDFLAGIVGTLVRVIVLVGLGIGAVLAFVALAGVIAGPFNELLSEEVEEELTGASGTPFSLSAFVGDAGRGIGHALRRLVVSLAWAIGLFALGFVPVVGGIAALVIGVYLAITGTAYDCYDAVLSRRKMAYADKLAYIARIRARSLGLGAAVTALLFVPGPNLAALGLGAVAATLTDHDLTERDRQDPGGDLTRTRTGR